MLNLLLVGAFRLFQCVFCYHCVVLNANSSFVIRKMMFLFFAVSGSFPLDCFGTCLNSNAFHWSCEMFCSLQHAAKGFGKPFSLLPEAVPSSWSSAPFHVIPLWELSLKLVYICAWKTLTQKQSYADFSKQLL